MGDSFHKAELIVPAAADHKRRQRKVMTHFLLAILALCYDTERYV